MGVKLKPDIFGCRTIGNIDDIYEVMINNCRVSISIPDLRYMLILHAHYLRYEREAHSTINLDEFYNAILTNTETFKGLPDDYVKSTLEKFTELLPILQQMKQYK